jgi:predicted RNA-binding protein YlqC (UPF0109 family)
VSDTYQSDYDAEDEIDAAEDMAGNRVVAAMSRSVLEFVARSIVDDPDAVVVEVDEARRGVDLKLHVAPDDMGKIIGRRGRVAQAIRVLVRAAGAREGLDTNVDIVED